MVTARRMRSTAAALTGLPCEGAIEIHDMEVLEALILKRFCLRGWIGMKYRGAAHIALTQPHAHAILEVDGGKENYGRGSFKRALPRDGRTLRIPSQEVGDEPQPKSLALFRMELRAHRGFVRDDGSYRTAVFRLCNNVALLRGAQMIGVHEISVQAPRPERYSLRNRMRPSAH